MPQLATFTVMSCVLLLLVAQVAQPPLGDQVIGQQTGASEDAEYLLAQHRSAATTRFLQNGKAELLLSSTLQGAELSFITTAAILTATRTNRETAWPLLVSAPLLGGLGGGTLSLAISSWLKPRPVEMALFSSSLWMGTGWGYALGLVIEQQSSQWTADPHQKMTLRFATMAISNIAVPVAGLAVARLQPLEIGDVGLINSAALWGAILGAIASDFRQPFGVTTTGAMWALAGSTLATTTGFALAGLIDLPRSALWLVDLFAGIGLAGAYIPLQIGQHPLGVRRTAIQAGGCIAGLVVGSTLAFLSSDFLLRLEAKLAGRDLPQLQLAVLPGSNKGDPALGLGLRFTLDSP